MKEPLNFLLFLCPSETLTVFKCYPNLSLVGVGVQTLKGGNISLVTALIDQFEGPF